MKQHIYTMPEKFLHDAEVPARWRILAVLNGFFLNHLQCWASNEWIGEQITAHKDSVSQGVKELEELGLIKVERTRRTRLISPILRAEIGANAYQDPPSTPISDRREHLSNSDSNSVSLYTADAVEKITIEEEGAKPQRKPKDSRAATLRAGRERKMGRKFTNPAIQESKITIMLQSGYTPKQIEEEYDWLEKQEFWRSKGVDYKVVASQIHKEHE